MDLWFLDLPRPPCVGSRNGSTGPWTLRFLDIPRPVCVASWDSRALGSSSRPRRKASAQRLLSKPGRGGVLVPGTTTRQSSVHWPLPFGRVRITPQRRGPAPPASSTCSPAQGLAGRGCRGGAGPRERAAYEWCSDRHCRQALCPSTELSTADPPQVVGLDGAPMCSRLVLVLTTRPAEAGPSRVTSILRLARGAGGPEAPQAPHRSF